MGSGEVVRGAQCVDLGKKHSPTKNIERRWASPPFQPLLLIQAAQLARDCPEQTS